MLLAVGLCFLETFAECRWLTWQKVFETSMAQVDDLTEIVNQNAKNAEEANFCEKKTRLWLFCFGDIQSNCCEAVGKIRQETKAFPAV